MAMDVATARVMKRAGALAGLCLAASVAACVTTTPPPAPPPPVASLPPALPELPAVQAPPRPVRKPVPPEPVLVPTPAGPPEDKFAELTGLDQPATVAIFGEPQLRTEAPPAQLWRYASGDCRLDVYFYLDLQTREMRVLHYDVTNADNGNDRLRQKCYAELAGRNDAAGSAARSR